MGNLKKNYYQLFDEGKLPHQEDIEKFASHSESNPEYWFKAGFLTAMNNVKDNYIIVRKEDLTLNWYKETKARLQKEEKNVEEDS